MNIAKGTFEVDMQPQADADHAMGRMLLNKKYMGEMRGDAQGQMLSHRIPQKGAGYVAMERLNVQLKDLSGSFMLQHFGKMTPKSQDLTVDIIPGSGTGDLAGITGSLEILINSGNHYYTLKYSLPEDPSAKVADKEKALIDS